MTEIIILLYTIVVIVPVAFMTRDGWVVKGGGVVVGGVTELWVWLEAVGGDSEVEGIVVGVIMEPVAAPSVK